MTTRERISLRKLRANRENAGKSTGPQTARGKAISRNNAFKHGMRSRSVVIPGEDPAEFAAMHHALVQEYHPASPEDHYLVKQLANARWRLERLLGIEAALLGADHIDMNAIERVSRWITRAERSCALALRQILDLCKTSAANAKSNPVKKKVPTGWWDPVTKEFRRFDYYPSEHPEDAPKNGDGNPDKRITPPDSE